MGKRVENIKKDLDFEKVYNLDEALKLVLDKATAKFDESIDLAISLGVDSKQSDQQVRGAVSLPNGLGKPVKILAIVGGDKEEEAKKAGADFVGGEDMIEKIKGGWLEFDKVVASPDVMSLVARVAKILGPKGLMPSPKTGTVTQKVGPTIEAEKKGRASFKLEKNNILHSSIGKKSMGFDKLKQNYQAFLDEIIKNKPKSSKGVYLKAISLSSTMGVGLKLKPTESL